MYVIQSVSEKNTFFLLLEIHKDYQLNKLSPIFVFEVQDPKNNPRVKLEKIKIYSNKIDNSLCMIFTILLTLWNSEPKKLLKIKLFCFSSDFDATWWSCSTHYVLQLHRQVSLKSDEKQKSFINIPFSVQNFKVSVESRKSYIVRWVDP